MTAASLVGRRPATLGQSGSSRDVGSNGTASTTTTARLRVSEWRAGEPPRELTLAEAELRAPEAEAFRCIEVPFDADRATAHADLVRLCGDRVTREMVDDILDEDPLPKVRTWDGDEIRSVSGFGARVDHKRETDPQPGLEFEIVEFLASRDWLIISCFSTGSYANSAEMVVETERGCRGLLDDARAHWADSDASAPGDLGILVLKQLARSYRHARKHLERWVEEWELDFYRDRDVALEDERERLERLIQLRGLIASYRERLVAMNVEREEASESWFCNVTSGETAEAVDKLVDESLAGLARLSDMVRAAFELHQSQTASRHLELSIKQQKSAEKLQGKVELVGSAFLVPTLIAGIFGANTALPGGNDPHRWFGFELMLIAMVVGAVIVYLVLKRMRQSGSASDDLRGLSRVVERESSQ